MSSAALSQGSVRAGYALNKIQDMWNGAEWGGGMSLREPPQTLADPDTVTAPLISCDQQLYWQWGRSSGMCGLLPECRKTTRNNCSRSAGRSERSHATRAAGLTAISAVEVWEECDHAAEDPNGERWTVCVSVLVIYLPEDLSFTGNY